MDASEATRVINSLWVFNIKRSPQGKILRYKARLVAQGSSQVHGLDYDETYAPVVRYDTLRLLIQWATQLGLEMHQIDFETAYLNSWLTDANPIYMRYPPGYGKAGMVLRLKKSLYGLKQSGREWFGTLKDQLLQKGYAQASFDPCVFIGDIVIAVYVDDLLLLGMTANIQAFKEYISKEFKCKDLGPVRVLLGLEIDVTPHRVTISQAGYVRRILKRFGMADCNTRKTPMDPNITLAKQDDVPVNEEIQKEYQQLIGSLNYLVVGTRPDLAFTISTLAQFNSNPSEMHLKTAYQVLRYLKRTMDSKLSYQRSIQQTPLPVVMFADASWGSVLDTARSVTGYVLQIGESTVSWTSKRQSCVAKSTCEAEYMACSLAASHLIWVKNTLQELSSSFKQLTTVPHSFALNTDNEAALSLIRDHRIHARSKHIAIHFHYVRERFLDGSFEVNHVPSTSNTADICTKALPLLMHEKMVELLNLMPG